MTRPIWILPALAVAGSLAALTLGPAEVMGEISTHGEPVGTTPPPALALAAGGTWHLECWQQGVKIIDEAEVGGISVRSLLDQDTVSFGAAIADHPTVTVLSLDDSTCLIRPRE